MELYLRLFLEIFYGSKTTLIILAQFVYKIIFLWNLRSYQGSGCDGRFPFFLYIFLPPFFLVLTTNVKKLTIFIFFINGVLFFLSVKLNACRSPSKCKIPANIELFGVMQRNRTPLMHCLQSENPNERVVKELLDRGAEVNNADVVRKCKIGMNVSD